MTTTKQPFGPQTLRAFLLVLLITVISGGAGLFYLGLNEVRTYAIEVNHSIADAEASDTQLQTLQRLKNQLAENEQLVAKANQMFATPENYQGQAMTDIQNYAAASGLTISKTSFEPLTPGVDPAMIVSLKAPVSYSKLIHFLNNIEGNIPKMQVANIDLSHVKGGGDSVTVNNIKITIATRQ